MGMEGANPGSTSSASFSDCSDIRSACCFEQLLQIIVRANSRQVGKHSRPAADDNEDARRGERFRLRMNRIEAALDKGIIDRADRQQFYTKDRLSKTERRKHQEEIVLSNAEFDVPTLRRMYPALNRR